jgi:hypothetical protein
MSAPPLADVRLTALPDGVRFDLPIWKAWRAVRAGLLLLLGGLLTAGAGAGLAYWVAVNFSASRGALWLAVPLLAPACCALLAGRLALDGACLLLGRRRVEAAGGRLRAAWRLGPVSLGRRERPLARLRRLVVLATSSRSGPKYPELVAGLEGNEAITLASYYPHDLLLALAHRLAQLEPAQVEISEEVRDFTGVRLRQPVRSRVAVASDAGGLALSLWTTWPSPLSGAVGIVSFPLSLLYIAAVNVGFFSAFHILTLLAAGPGAPTLDGLEAAASFGGLYAAVLLCWAARWACGRLNRTRLILLVRGGVMTARWEGVFGTRERSWACEDITDVAAFIETIDLGTSEGGGRKTQRIQGLRILARTGSAVNLGGSDVALPDWEWVATTLRLAIGQSRAAAPASPAPARTEVFRPGPDRRLPLNAVCLPGPTGVAPPKKPRP